jgi:hypothetical protein
MHWEEHDERCLVDSGRNGDRERGHRRDTRAEGRWLTDDQTEQRLLGLAELLAVSNGDDAAE